MSSSSTSDSDPPLLEDVEDPHLDAWAEYLGGKWTLTRPELPGVYAVATREGHYVGLRELRMREGEVVDPHQAVNEPGWCGFYWSVPLPPPPKDVPDIEEELH